MRRRGGIAVPVPCDVQLGIGGQCDCRIAVAPGSESRDRAGRERPSHHPRLRVWLDRAESIISPLSGAIERGW